MKAICVIFSLISFNPDIYTINEKPFETYSDCLRWKHQQEFLSPYEGHQSWYYCEEKT